MTQKNPEIPVIYVYVDERLPEGAQVRTLIERSGLDFATCPTSGTIEVNVRGFRYVGLRDIREVIKHLQNLKKNK